MVEREYRVLRALEGVGFASPRALALCEDESVAGSVFYLMAHVDGRIFWDPALPGMSREERGAIFDSMNATLVRLQFVGLNMKFGRSTVMLTERICNGIPCRIIGNGSETIRNAVVCLSTLIAARTTTVPRSNGPAIAGTTIDNPNGAPL